MADLAHAFHWQPSELAAMEVGELMVWHAQIGRINRDMERRS